MNRTKLFINLEDLNKSCKLNSKSISFDNIYGLDDLTNREINIIKNRCSYICDICKHDYIYKCSECEFAKDFEFEVEKQKLLQNYFKKINYRRRRSVRFLK